MGRVRGAVRGRIMTVIWRPGDRIQHRGGGVRIWTPRGGAAPVIPWYLSGGIAAANCLAVYQPKGAVGLADSYNNLAAPGNGLPDGTYDAYPGTAPTWDAVNGWSGATSLNTDLIPTVANTWSAIVRFSNAGAFTNTALFYAQNGGFGLFQISVGDRREYRNYSAVRYVGVATASGVIAFAGNQAYINSVSDGAMGGPILGAPYPNIVLVTPGAVRVQAYAFYNVTISAAQVAAVSAAVALL